MNQKWIENESNKIIIIVIYFILLHDLAALHIHQLSFDLLRVRRVSEILLRWPAMGPYRQLIAGKVQGWSKTNVNHVESMLNPCCIPKPFLVAKNIKLVCFYLPFWFVIPFHCLPVVSQKAPLTNNNTCMHYCQTLGYNVTIHRDWLGLTIWVCLKIVYPYTQWFCWSLSLFFMAISLGV